MPSQAHSPSELDEITTLYHMRNAVYYKETTNSLIEWTLSPEWLSVPKGRSQDAIAGEINL